MFECIDLTGQTFERLTVIKRVEDHISKTGYKSVQWLCKCDCDGKEVIIVGRDLKKGSVKSCGCLFKEVIKELRFKRNTYDLTGEYGIGYTTKGEEFWFDLKYYDKIKNYCWFLNSGYVVAYSVELDKIIKIFNIIMNPKKNEEVDHINRKDLHDNRKSNLRICSRQQNVINRGLQSNNTSGYTGVAWDKRRNKWLSYIILNKKHTYLGLFTNKDDAIKVRLQAEKEYFKEFAPQQHLYEEYGIN